MGKAITKGDQTRAALLEAAFELFSRQGYHATTMRQIAEQTGVTPGSIYNHFFGKDDIFLSVLSAYHPLNQFSSFLADSKADTTEQFIRLLAERVTEVMDEQPGLLNLFFIEMVELDGQHLPSLVEEFRSQVMSFVERVSSGPDQSRIPPIKAFRVFLGLIFAYEMSDRLVQIALKDETIDPGGLDDFVDVYLHGILKPETRNEKEQ
jgi:AcrR family transcriptional regulator